MTAAVAALHAVGIAFLLLALLAPGRSAAALGIGLTAYVLGMRHAFDADHIAVIDNTTRKLVQDGKNASTVGLWFSLGHSTVVLVLALAVALGARALAGQIQDASSPLHVVTGWVGPLISGGFLVIIGVINLVTLIRLVRLPAHGQDGDASVEHLLGERGFLARLLGPALRAIDRPGRMYPIGLLFGLGFDTATEIGLLVLAGGAGGAALPWYAVPCLPLLFAAGMCLFDTAEGAVMASAYGWAVARPRTKFSYNVVVTAVSVVVAFGVSWMELLGTFGDQLGWHGTFWTWVDRVGGATWTGFAIAGLLMSSWAVALVARRRSRSDSDHTYPQRSINA